MSNKNNQVTHNFSFRITKQMERLIDKNNPNDPIAKQFMPSEEELKGVPSEKADPISDALFTPLKGIVHRYPDRCLLMPVLVCPVYCRFCFRKEKVGQKTQTLTPTEMDHAFRYIEEHKEIWEVILTGGDPFILKPANLKKLLKKLVDIPHVEVIRIHTRIPVVDSKRISEEMINALRCGKPLYVILHANHASEFSEEASNACARLVDAGIPMLSQTVLLKNLNDTIEALSTLMRCFIKHRIKPYYLHHADLVKGTSHFRTSIQQGQALVKQLRGRFSGLCQPTYVLDIPGGFGKVPIGPSYINQEDNQYLVEDYNSKFHNYPSS